MESKNNRRKFCGLRLAVDKAVCGAFWIAVIGTFMLGVCSLDSLAENGRYGLMLAMLFVPFVVGWAGARFLGLDRYIKK